MKNDRFRFRFDKLVRDGWADWSRSMGVEAHQRLLPRQEHLAALGSKLIEEAEEVSLEVRLEVSPEVAAAGGQDEILEELSDVLEVIRAIAHAAGLSFEDVENRRLLKYRQKGGFEKGTWCAFVEVAQDSPHLPYYLARPGKYPRDNGNS